MQNPSTVGRNDNFFVTFYRFVLFSIREVDGKFVLIGAGNGPGRSFGNKDNAEVIRSGDELLTATRRPDVLRGRDNSRHLDRHPLFAGEQVDGVTGDQLEVVGEMLLNK